MYPSKILLFGEYTILLNSYALAIPFNKFSGELVFMDAGSKGNHLDSIRSNQILKEFLAYSGGNSVKEKLSYPFDNVAFESDLQKGLYFKSDIPEESGLGSSGALVAAIFDRYNKIKKSDRDLPEIRKCLGLYESFFHGTSSGVDPLVSYLKSPVLIENNEIKIPVNSPLTESLKKAGLFLIYFSQSRKTGNLVNYFNNKCKSEKEYLSKITELYIPVNNECIISLINNYNSIQFFSAIRKIALLQFEIFDEMIPDYLVPMINHGLKNDLFYLKLCGSGGGGYFLGFTKDLVKTKSYFNNLGYKIIAY